MKTCRLCGEAKKLDEFYALTRNKDNKDSRCKVCVRSKAKEVYLATRDVDKIKERNLKIRYGLSVEEYDKLISDGCFICGTHERLCIDHDHSCCPGKESCGNCIRGVLCWNHNIGEAKFKDIKEIERLWEYRNR
jgi:hypothetical protein